MPKVSKMALVAGAAELIASAGAAVVVGNLVKATTPYDLNRVQKVLVGIGSYAIGGVLSDLSAKYVHSQIDDYSERVRSIFHPDVIVVEEEVDQQEKAEEPVKKVRKKTVHAEPTPIDED